MVRLATGTGLGIAGAFVIPGSMIPGALLMIAGFAVLAWVVFVDDFGEDRRRR